MKIAFFLCFLILHLGVYGQAPEKNIAPEIQNIDYKASPRPDRILLNWAENDLSTQGVTWRTDTTITQAYAEIAEVTAGYEFYKENQKYTAKTSSVEAIDEVVKYHSVVFEVLKPDTYYAYRVGGGEYWSEWIQFKTAPVTPQPFSFIYLGDAQNDLFPLWSRVVRQAFMKRADAKFMLHTGDLINHSKNNYEWGEWFAGSSFIARTMPQLIAAGNHEYVKDAEGHKTGISPMYDPQFNFPDNGLPELGDTNYFIDYLNSKVIVLNSNEKIKEQALWLERILRENQKDWVIVSFHHPIISGAKGRQNHGIMEHWKPLLDDYRVDLVLQGHDHLYGRGREVSDHPPGTEASGTVYVVSVSGRKMYALSDHPWMEKKAEKQQFYQIIDIDDQSLEYRAYTTDNELFDSFQLKKRKNQKNEFNLLEK